MVESWTDERLQKQIDYYAEYLGLGENESDQSDAGFALDALRAFQECRKQIAAAEARGVERGKADRDAAWERAIEAWWNKKRRASDSKDFLAAIREILEAEGGRA